MTLHIISVVNPVHSNVKTMLVPLKKTNFQHSAKFNKNVIITKINKFETVTTTTN